MKTNPDVYPVTAAFEKFCDEQLHKSGETGKPFAMRRMTATFLAGIMSENLGEYEHGGAANAQDLLPDSVAKCLRAFGVCNERKDSALEGRSLDDLALETISAVYQDLLLVVLNAGE